MMGFECWKKVWFEAEVKRGVEKSLTGRWCPGRDELRDSRPGTTRRRSVEHVPSLGAMRVENDMAEERLALT